MPIDPHQAIAALVRAEAARITQPAAPVSAPPQTALSGPAPAEQCPPAGPALLRWIRRRPASA
jgi:hypothetical protein